MLSKLKSDIPSSVVVFLVALPLCLGIALASGAPLISGLIAGIVGGLVVGSISASHTSVSGPAAGLTAVVLSSITKLGSFETFLLAVFLAGAIQFISGVIKAGFIADYVPSNVIKGLLAAIGVILILKQIPHAVGYDADPEGDLSFIQPDGENTFTELMHVFYDFNGGAIIISVISILMLVYWNKTPFAKYNFLPASFAVVVVGLLINLGFEKFFPDMYLSEIHEVHIPAIKSIDELVTFPSFERIFDSKVWIVAFTIAAVANLETLLNLEAVENIDPHKRKASPNRELVAQGVGNMVCGLIGGIPLTSVIIRSSVNIQSGAETKLSAIIHGGLLLLSVLILYPVINMIPLASLAGILLFTGYKLARVSLFKEMYHKGLNQFIPFVVTISAIVFTDLLIGILIGLAVSIFYILKSNFSNPFTVKIEENEGVESYHLQLSDQVSFLNKAAIKEVLWNRPEGCNVVIDARRSGFIDNDVLEEIHDFRDTVSLERNINLKIVGLKERYEAKKNVAEEIAESINEK